MIPGGIKVVDRKSTIHPATLYTSSLLIRPRRCPLKALYHFPSALLHRQPAIHPDLIYERMSLHLPDDLETARQLALTTDDVADLNGCRTRSLTYSDQ